MRTLQKSAPGKSATGGRVNFITTGSKPAAWAARACVCAVSSAM
jgi:hypothetical protein